MPRRLERIKPPKAAAPEDTTRRIQELLAHLGLKFAEQVISREKGRFACCLQLPGAVRAEPVFQTMGKGRTEAYAKASAYGEMIERVQNLAVYMMLFYPAEPEWGSSAHHLTFKYYPDERSLTTEELRSGINRLFHNDSAVHPSLLTRSTIGVPFWSVFGAHRVYLPFRALQVTVGSNGMCSGNTQAEAVIHGICEVFERHVLKQLFLTSLNPPEVPLEVFDGHEIYDDLLHLAESCGYEIQVKDCSLGQRLPVVGLMIQDGRGGYAFHLGSDPSPVTALERCLTEMCQGGKIHFKAVDELKNADGDVRVSEFWREQLHLNIRSYEGHWPPALLRHDLTHTFHGFDHPVSVSDEEDLNYLLSIIDDAGWDLLIRDNSFLGFPSYYVYIPGISEMTNALDSGFANEYLAFDRHIPALTNLAEATDAQKRAMARSLKSYQSVAPSRHFRAADYLMYCPEHPLARLPQAELDVLLRHSSRRRVPLDLPKCFDCPSCGWTSRCHYPFLASVWMQTKAVMARHLWSQSALALIAGPVRRHPGGSVSV